MTLGRSPLERKALKYGEYRVEGGLVVICGEALRGCAGFPDALDFMHCYWGSIITSLPLVEESGCQRPRDRSPGTEEQTVWTLLFCRWKKQLKVGHRVPSQGVLLDYTTFPKA